MMRKLAIIVAVVVSFLVVFPVFAQSFGMVSSLGSWGRVSYDGEHYPFRIYDDVLIPGLEYQQDDSEDLFGLPVSTSLYLLINQVMVSPALDYPDDYYYHGNFLAEFYAYYGFYDVSDPSASVNLAVKLVLELEDGSIFYRDYVYNVPYGELSRFRTYIPASDINPNPANYRRINRAWIQIKHTAHVIGMLNPVYIDGINLSSAIYDYPATVTPAPSSTPTPTGTAGCSTSGFSGWTLHSGIGSNSGTSLSISYPNSAVFRSPYTLAPGSYTLNYIGHHSVWPDYTAVQWYVGPSYPGAYQASGVAHWNNLAQNHTINTSGSGQYLWVNFGPVLYSGTSSIDNFVLGGCGVVGPTPTPTSTPTVPVVATEVVTHTETCSYTWTFNDSAEGFRSDYAVFDWWGYSGRMEGFLNPTYATRLISPSNATWRGLVGGVGPLVDGYIYADVVSSGCEAQLYGYDHSSLAWTSIYTSSFPSAQFPSRFGTSVTGADWDYFYWKFVDYPGGQTCTDISIDNVTISDILCQVSEVTPVPTVTSTVTVIPIATPAPTAVNWLPTPGATPSFVVPIFEYTGTIDTGDSTIMCGVPDVPVFASFDGCLSPTFPGWPGLTINLSVYFLWIADILYYLWSVLLCWLAWFMSLFLWLFNAALLWWNVAAFNAQLIEGLLTPIGELLTAWSNAIGGLLAAMSLSSAVLGDYFGVLADFREFWIEFQQITVVSVVLTVVYAVIALRLLYAAIYRIIGGSGSGGSTEED